MNKEIHPVMQALNIQGYLVVGYPTAQKLGTRLPLMKDAQGTVIPDVPVFMISAKGSRWDARQQVILLETIVGKKFPRQPNFKFWYRAVVEVKIDTV